MVVPPRRQVQSRSANVDDDDYENRGAALESSLLRDRQGKGKLWAMLGTRDRLKGMLAMTLKRYDSYDSE